MASAMSSPNNTLSGAVAIADGEPVVHAQPQPPSPDFPATWTKAWVDGLIRDGEGGLLDLLKKHDIVPAKPYIGGAWRPIVRPTRGYTYVLQIQPHGNQSHNVIPRSGCMQTYHAARRCPLSSQIGIFDFAPLPVTASCERAVGLHYRARIITHRSELQTQQLSMCPPNGNHHKRRPQHLVRNNDVVY
eukprot:COSAG02_NODE_21582_length_782_cov_1.127379_1_plen_188_part_00